MDRITSFIIACLFLAGTIFADNTQNRPVTFVSGSSLTINSGVHANFLTGSVTSFAGSATFTGAADFTGATVTGVSVNAGNLTGTVLAPGVVTSSLTSAAGGAFGTAAYTPASNYLAKSNNLSDLVNAATARTNLGLGTIATQAGTGTSTEIQQGNGSGGLTPVAADTVFTFTDPLVDFVPVHTYTPATWITVQFNPDGTLADNSDTEIATQKAVKTYVDAHSGGAPGGVSGDFQYNSTGTFAGITPGTGIATWFAAPTEANFKIAQAGLSWLDTANTFTANQTVSGASIGTSGNISRGGWGPNGVRYKNTPGTLNDSSSSGTVSKGYTDTFGGDTITASSVMTFTTYVGSYFNQPVAGTNVTFTNSYAMGADSMLVNGGAFDGSGTSSFKVRAASGASPVGDGQIANDTATHQLKFGSNGSTRVVATTVASGTSALGTSSISSGSCATVVTTTATGALTTDTISWTPNTDISGVTGYAPVTTGALIIYPYPTANNVNWKVCNPTSLSITPGAVTLNWRISR